MGDYNDIFKLETFDTKNIAKIYTRGLFASSRRNLERMDERIDNSQYDQLHHFLSDSPWQARKLIDRVASRSYSLLSGKSQLTGLPLGLYIDETSFRKKGTKSVGVKRQYLGCIGKVDNGQVAVFSALGTGSHCALIDCRLYLPECWVNDKERCNQAKIPLDQREYKTKIELALESIEHIDNKGVIPDFYAIDALYGSSMVFMNTLELHGKPVLGRVRRNFKLYLEKPHFYLPERKFKKGRAPKKMRTDAKAFSALAVQLNSKEEDWQRIEVRDTDKGKLILDVIHKKIWVRCKDTNKTFARDFLITRENEEGKIKYSYTLVIASKVTDLQKLVQMDRQRYWIERSFQDVKNEVGMDEYQVRKYDAFYHHMSLSMLAYLFLTEQRMCFAANLELLSCADIKKFLEFLIPNKAMTIEEMYMQMQTRHKKRRASTQSSYRRQAKT